MKPFQHLSLYFCFFVLFCLKKKAPGERLRWVGLGLESKVVVIRLCPIYLETIV